MTVTNEIKTEMEEDWEQGSLNNWHYRLIRYKAEQKIVRLSHNVSNFPAHCLVGEESENTRL